VRLTTNAKWTTFGEATGRMRSSSLSDDEDEDEEATARLRPPPFFGGSLALTREELASARPRSLLPVVLVAASTTLACGGVLADRYVPSARSFVARVPSFVSDQLRPEPGPPPTTAPSPPAVRATNAPDAEASARATSMLKDASAPTAQVHPPTPIVAKTLAAPAPPRATAPVTPTAQRASQAPSVVATKATRKATASKPTTSATAAKRPPTKPKTKPKAPDKTRQVH
jgi:hypothetical protein